MKTNTALILLLMIAAVPAQMFAQESSSRAQRFSDGIYSQPVSREKAHKGSGASADAVNSLKDETLASELFVNKEVPVHKDSVKLDFSDLYNDPSWYNDSIYWYPSWYWRFSPYYSRAFYGYTYYSRPYWGGPYYGRWSMYYDPWYYDSWAWDYAFYGNWYPWYGPYYGPYFSPYGTYGYWYDHPHHGYDGYVPGYYADSQGSSRNSTSGGRGINSAGGRTSSGPRNASRLSQGAVARADAPAPRSDIRLVSREASSTRTLSGSQAQPVGRAASVSKGAATSSSRSTISSPAVATARPTASAYSSRGTASTVRSSAPVSSSTS